MWPKLMGGSLGIVLTTGSLSIVSVSVLYMFFVGAGAYSGCAYCTQKGEHSKALSKIVYLEHRSFLRKGDLLRLDTLNFPPKGICTSSTT